MYFHSRIEAGQKLADELVQYANTNAIIIALSRGAVVIGEQIAQAVQCQLTLLLTENIRLPGEQSALGTVTQDGSFVYNNMLSAGEIEEYYSEFHSYIEDQKREKFEKINSLLGEGGLLEAAMLKDRIVILVSDGLKTGISLKAAEQFLKPVHINKLIIAAPVASVSAVDAMHIMADEIHCLSVTQNYISTNHYYDDNTLPTKDEIIAKIKVGT